ncbi:MAG: nitrous oxide reductase family maturation protein NosD [Flavobacteriales bacterium]|nr:nitrous oxide reductase family maturation protein NosD [Flavobacteriales bacterium]
MLSARTWSVVAGKGEGLVATIARAQARDTIVIEGMVREGNVTVDKPLVLIGRPGAGIDGERKGEVLTVTSGDVVVQGLVIRGTRISNLDDNAGIKVKEARRIALLNNRLEGCFFAIYLSGVSDARVEGNTIVGENLREEQMGNGIHLWKCKEVRVLRNTVERHRDGIYFEFVTDSRIEGNLSRGNMRYGLHFMFSHRDAYADNHFEDNGAGVAVMFSHHIDMQRNRFIRNRGGSAYGLLLKEINDGEIRDNVFTDNTTALLVDGCNRIKAMGNTFLLNGWALRLYANSMTCTFEANVFQGNTFDMSTNGELLLNTIVGNYWDRYTGYDLDRDGRGDVPYRPLGFFALLVERVPFAMVFSRSLFVALLDRAERIIPTLSPEAMRDDRPLMRRPHG